MADPGFLEGHQLPKLGVLTYYFAKNSIKMKGFGPPGEGAPVGLDLIITGLSPGL